MSWIALLIVDDQAYRSYINAFQACYYLYTYSQDFYIDPEAKSEISDNSNKDPKKQAKDKYPLADFEAFARWRPQEDFTCIDLLNSLGSREIDCNYD